MQEAPSGEGVGRLWVGPDGVLVGRDEELAVMVEARRRKEWGGVVIVGAAGVGKTGLARRFVERAGEDGAPTEWLASTRSTATIPFGAFAPLLDAATDTGSAVDVVRRLLDSIRSRKGAVVGIDDAQHLDEGSAALLHQLTIARSCFVVVTVRSGESVPDAVQALWKDGLALRLELQPLARVEVVELLRQLLGGQIDSSAARRIAEASGGNPLFVRELVSAGRATGSLVERRGVWAWEGPMRPGSTIHDLLNARLSRLGPRARGLLEILALGEPIAANLIDRIGGEDLVAALEHDGLVRGDVTAGRAELRMAHPLYGESLRDAMGQAARRRAYGRLADLVEGDGGGGRNDLLRETTWRLEAGGVIGAEQLTEAATLAIDLHDQGLAERLARAATAAGAGNRAYIKLAESLYWQGRFEEADELQSRIDLDHSPHRERVELAVLQASTRFWGLAQVVPALERLADAADPEAEAHASMIELLAGGTETGLGHSNSVLASDDVPPRAAVRATATRVIALAVSGAADRAVAEAVGGVGAALEMGDRDPMPAGGIVVGQFLGYLVAGRLTDLSRLAASLYEQSIQREADDFRGLWAFLAGRAALAEGRLDGARERLVEAAALLDGQDVGGVRPWCLGALGQAAGQAGDAPASAAAVAEATARPSAIRIWTAEITLGRAWAAQARGETSRARTLALGAADECVRSGLRGIEVQALHDAVRLGATRGAGGRSIVQRLVTLEAHVDGGFAAAAAEHARASAAGDGSGLDAVAGRFASMGAMLLAGETASEAAGVYASAGRAGPALSARERSRRWLDGCGLPRTPALQAAVALPDVSWLTEREREVAGLAATGLTRREIADRLYLSVRTVGNHLNHVYGKLGIGTRDDLARLFGGDGVGGVDGSDERPAPG